MSCGDFFIPVEGSKYKLFYFFPIRGKNCPYHNILLNPFNGIQMEPGARERLVLYLHGFYDEAIKHGLRARENPVS
jgi:hypothetical protein